MSLIFLYFACFFFVFFSLLFLLDMVNKDFQIVSIIKLEYELVYTICKHVRLRNPISDFGASLPTSTSCMEILSAVGL